MRELRGRPDEADNGGRAERDGPAAGAVRGRVELRSRAEYAADAELGLSLEVVRRFDARRAGLSEVSAKDAAAYLDACQAERPWLAAARAQLDPAKRAAAIDGLKSPEASHHCRAASSRITDPDAFAVAFARGIEHPTVRAALDAKFTPGQVPRPVSLSIGDLLGPDGYRYCTGWRLQPVEGSMTAAREHRAASIEARGQGRDAAGPEMAMKW